MIIASDSKRGDLMLYPACARAVRGTDADCSAEHFVSIQNDENRVGGAAALTHSDLIHRHARRLDRRLD